MPYVNDKFCFLHIPKTGGISRNDVLKNNGYTLVGHEHDPLSIHDIPAHIISVCYIREPIAWYKSWWSFINSGPSDGSHECWWFQNNGDLHRLGRGNTFEQFIRLLPHGRLRKIYDAYISGVDLVERMEDLQQHFLGLTGLTISHLNKSRSDFEISEEIESMIRSNENAIYEKWYS